MLVLVRNTKRFFRRVEYDNIRVKYDELLGVLEMYLFLPSQLLNYYSFIEFSASIILQIFNKNYITMLLAILRNSWKN